MFDSLKKKLREGIQKLSKKVAEKEPERDFEKEEEFLHEKEISLQELKEEPEQLEKEEEKEEHVEEAEAEAEAEEVERDEELKRQVGEEAEEPDREEEKKEEWPEPAPATEDRVLKKEEVLEKRGFLKKLRGLPQAVTQKELSPEDIREFFSDMEADLLYSNVAVEVIDSFRELLSKELAEKKIPRGRTEQVLKEAFRKALLEIVDQGEIDFGRILKEKPALLLFLGFNGSGKTTSLAKVGHYLQKEGHSVVLAAGDTFRAASIEQLEHHGKKLGVKTIKHQYGGDSAAVIFDAKKHAKAQGIDFVLADTAGRTHVDRNLLDELKKVVRVNKPALKILVVDSLTGNDAVEQAALFNKEVGVDAVILTKLDVNKKGGSLLSVCWAIKRPILFLGTGQGYGDLLRFEPEQFVRELVG